jgi:hypothetical protein
MNGTSMSSPNAAGCIALLLSAALTQDIKISSMNMKRIVENSAKMIIDVDVLGQVYLYLYVYIHIYIHIYMEVRIDVRIY